MRFAHLLFACSLLAAGLSARAATREFTHGESVELEPGNGLLAVDIDTGDLARSVKLDRIGALFGGITLTGLDSSANLRLLELPAGNYRWSRVDLSYFGAYLRVRDDPRFRFRVDPGVINYAGDFSVAPTEWVGSFHLDSSNHAARMLVHLDRDFPGVSRRFPMRYQGAFPDRFLQFATRELGAQSAVDAFRAGTARAIANHAEDALAGLHLLVTELFARPQVRAVRLNPRGDLVAMIEYRDGKNRVSLLDTQTHFAVDVYRGDVAVRNLYFAGDRTLLFELDLAGGDNNYVVHVSLKGEAAPSFTQFVIPGTGWFVDPTPEDGSHVTYARMNDDGATHIFRIKLDGNRFSTAQFRSERRLDKGLQKAFFGLADSAGTLRLALTSVGGDYAMMYRADAGSDWREVRRFGADEVFEPVALSRDGTNLVALTNAGRNQTDLVRITLPSGAASETLYSLAGTDIDGVLLRGMDHQVVGVTAYDDGHLETRYLHASDDATGSAVARALPGKSIAIYDTDKDRNRMLILATDELDPGTFYLYDKVLNTLQTIESAKPAMPHVHPARSRVLRVTARDAMPIESYLTLPMKATPPYPLVVMPHGGPIGVRDALQFDPEVQLLANRGYAVLRVNYRGSTGFGRAFEEAGFGAWGKSIEDDILAAVDAAIGAAPIDRNRVALRGASYGGYSTLMGLIRTPERFRCGVAIAAVSDVPLLFTSSDWSQDQRSRRRVMQIVGDPTRRLDEMEAVSPDYQYRKLKRPLLLIHGGADRRVPAEHALRLLLLLGHENAAPQTLIFPGEGHGITDPADRFQAEAAIDAFLSTCLKPEPAPPPTAG
ncbi:MAG TPA: prolyl oligopeptidase family serine peptidase [Rhodanobacteraceae bacterium]|nr:prolyl oligopeptidase family serine peptidase [Rhodanobacteraceae bacterium]